MQFSSKSDSRQFFNQYTLKTHQTNKTPDQIFCNPNPFWKTNFDKRYTHKNVANAQVFSKNNTRNLFQNNHFYHRQSQIKNIQQIQANQPIFDNKKENPFKSGISVFKSNINQKLGTPQALWKIKFYNEDNNKRIDGFFQQYGDYCCKNYQYNPFTQSQTESMGNTIQNCEISSSPFININANTQNEKNISQLFKSNINKKFGTFNLFPKHIFYNQNIYKDDKKKQTKDNYEINNNNPFLNHHEYSKQFVIDNLQSYHDLYNFGASIALGQQNMQNNKDRKLSGQDFFDLSQANQLPVSLDNSLVNLEPSKLLISQQKQEMNRKSRKMYNRQEKTEKIKQDNIVIQEYKYFKIQFQPIKYTFKIKNLKVYNKYALIKFKEPVLYLGKDIENCVELSQGSCRIKDADWNRAQFELTIFNVYGYISKNNNEKQEIHKFVQSYFHSQRLDFVNFDKVTGNVRLKGKKQF